ncbi:MAG: hypothetical protein AAFW81_12900, partial [Pseudomonadota bacterium]
ERITGAYEKRIDVLEKERLVLHEKLERTGQPQRGFAELFELAMAFIANPRILWDSGRLAHRQTVLKLCFQDKPRYCRKNGFSNPV